MKQIKQLNLTLITIFLTACSSSSLHEPSHNDDKFTTLKANEVEEKRFLQKHLDSWLEEDWSPAVKEKDEEAKDRFKLQDYYDKLHLYNASRKPDANESNIENMENMPVIGK